MRKPTPGSWIDIPGCPCHAIKADGRVIASVNWFDDYPKEQIANARLIAAAPELLEALQQLYEHTKNDYTIAGLNTKAHVAITKATTGKGPFPPPLDMKERYRTT